MLTQKTIPCPYRFCRTPPFAQRVFFGTQIGQHSDLKAQGLVTVMAVAAEFHRDFLTPVRKAHGFGIAPNGLCYSFVDSRISRVVVL
jgi:hypothetical protein